MTFRCVAVLLAGTACLAQDQGVKPKRKTIGVALAGGSALGLSHVGTLQWFEEHRIPIDYIAGTSMGGLVAGLYATGHDSQEMLEFVANVDWEAALATVPPYTNLSFRRKEDQRAIPTNLELGYKKGSVRLPGGLSAGQGVGLILSRFAAPYSQLSSFNDLPTPFRCVATDLVSAQKVVFDRGPLYDAMRASMSLPALFAPVERGNQVLVDGGLVDNLPVDIVKEMGADIVIAVALDKPVDPKAYQSLLSVAGRSVSVMITDNERKNIGLADLVVMPDLEGMDAMGFSKYEDFRKVGYEAAERKEMMLRPFQLSPEDYRAYQDERAKKRLPEIVSPKFIEVEGDVAKKREAALISALRPDENGVLPRTEIEDQMMKLTGLGRFDTAGYEFIHKNGEEGLRVKVHEKPNGPPFLKLGLLLDGSPDDGLRFGVYARLTFLDIGGPASEWRTDLAIGPINRAASEYYYRLGGGKWFVAPRGYYEADLWPYYSDRTRVLEYRTQTVGGGADLGYAFGRFQELRLGYDIGRLNYKITAGSVPGSIAGRTSGFRGKWSYDRQDSAVIPRHGIRSTVTANWMTDYPEVEKAFPIVQGDFSYAGTINRRYSYITGFEGGTTSNNESLSLFFHAGGLHSISALARGQLNGNHYYTGRATLLRSFSDDPIGLLGRMYLTVGYEAGTAWTAGGSAKPFNDGLLGISGETPLGLLFFGGSIGERGYKSILFRLGRYF